MCSAGLKVQNFQARTEPIRLFDISKFTPIVKDELAVLQQGAAVGLPAETRITYDTLLGRAFSFQFIAIKMMLLSCFFFYSIVLKYKH